MEKRLIVFVDDSGAKRKVLANNFSSIEVAKYSNKHCTFFQDCTDMGDDEFEKFIKSLSSGQGGMDIGYESEAAFRDACYWAGYDASDMLSKGIYVACADGTISAKDYADGGDFEYHPED